MRIPARPDPLEAGIPHTLDRSAVNAYLISPPPWRSCRASAAAFMEYALD